MEPIQDFIRKFLIDIYQDLGVPDQLVAQAQKTFDRMLQKQADAKVTLTERKQAEEIERKLLAGTGLTAEQFKPITVMWDVCELLESVDNREQANKTLQKYFSEKTNRDKLTADAGGGIGPFSAKVGYEKEMTQKNVDEGYFENNTAYSNFKKRNSSEKGQRPVITPRGLNLLEKPQFVSNVWLAVSAVAYYPVEQRKVRSVPVTCFQRAGRLQMFPIDAEKRLTDTDKRLMALEGRPQVLDMKHYGPEAGDLKPTNSSGYLVLGDTLVQWGVRRMGVGNDNYVVTLPVPFADSNYAVTLSPLFAGGAQGFAAASFHWEPRGNPKQQFYVDIIGSQGNQNQIKGYPGGAPFSYVAIGKAPPVPPNK